ncbi:MAG: response regulator transcription factor, partial [Actinomycetota bacterium]
VSGYVVKERDVAEIAEVIRLVARGHFVMPGEISDQRGTKRVDVRSLTDVEREILKGVALGETNSKIGARLHMSQRTVSRRLEGIYSKLDLPDRLQAAVYAATHGIVKPPSMAS